MNTEKRWRGLPGQYVEGDNGEKWYITDVIERAKSLKPFVIPLKHLCTAGRTIGGMPIGKFVGHMRQVLDADVTFPIILDDEGAVFDGRHRVAKALLERLDRLPAVRFDIDPPPTVGEIK